jgi:2-oxoglutarate dehydrogenase E2 component (dihydrolipoamide succinyltransferase)
MATEVLMPQMGESIAEGTITKWLIKTGERVERDQPLFEISTDKVDAEIPSPATGLLIEVRFAEGSTVAVNQVVALIGGAAEATQEDAPPAPAGPPPTQRKPEPVRAAAMAAPAVTAPARSPEPGSLAERVRAVSSPLVRSIAAKEGVELSRLPGSGIHGRVTKQDILAHLEARAAAPAMGVPATAGSGAAAGVATKIDTGFHVAAYGPNETVVIEPMSKIRQITAAHMRYSKDTSAHVTTVFEMDFAKVHRARERAKAQFHKVNGTKLSYMPFIFKAVAAGLKSNPKLNAAVDGTNVIFKKDINLGMAVALDWGLLVPVVRNADQLNLVGLAKAANDLADRARAKKLGPDEVKGGTFTITNPGVFGSLFGTPIISQPQVAILGIGAIEKRLRVFTDEDGNDHIVIKPMAYFGITYDHRLVDGADADHFMNAVKKVLEGDSWPELEPYY